VFVVSGKPLVIACTGTGNELTTRTKAASSELILFLFGIIGIPFYIFQDFGVSGFRDKISQLLN
jgi:hypothetical protein